MDFSPPHGFTKNNSFTKAVYRDVYAAIDPKRPQLSQKGKVVLITGASRGIGKDGLAVAFALAGARAIIITARKVETLKETEALIKKTNPAVEVLPVALEITSESSIESAFSTIASTYPQIDVLVNNAGIFNSINQPLATGSPSKWWNDFDVNVRGTYLVTRAFLSHLPADSASPAHVIFMSSGAAFLVGDHGNSAYNITKLIDLQLAAYVAAENKNVRAVSVHPGIIVTDIIPGETMFTPYAKDTPLLAGANVNWLASEEADFLNGRFVYANWDVEELKARKAEIVEQDLLTVKLSGLVGTVAEVKG